MVKSVKKLTEKKNLNNKLDLLLKNQKKILKNEAKILGEEKKIETLENEELINEDKEISEEKEALDELKSLEKEINDNKFNPINKITKRDIFKGFIGAFVGIIGHFAFSEASDIAKHVTFFQATILYVVAFLLIVIMLYYTGFRHVKKHIVAKYMPLRALILYVVSLVAVVIINLLFGKIHFPIHFVDLYILVGTNILLAAIGAGTADLIGGSGE